MGASFDDLTEVPLSMFSANIYGNAYPDLPEMIPYKAYKNNVKDLFELGGIYDLSLNINRYTESGNFTATLSRMNQDSYIPYADFGRYSMSVGGNQTLANGVRVVEMFLTQEHSKMVQCLVIISLAILVLLHLLVL